MVLLKASVKRLIFERCVTVVILCASSLVVTSQSQPVSTTEAAFKKCWEVEASVLPEQGIAADETQAYFAHRNGKVISVELTTGKISWSAEIGGTAVSELVLIRGIVFTIAKPVRDSAGSKPVLRAFSAVTGLPVWNLELPAAPKYYLVGDDSDLAVISSEGDVWYLDVAGTIKWKAAALGTILSLPRIEDGRILVAVNGKRVEEYSGESGARIASSIVDGVPAFVGAGKSSAAVYSDERGNVHSINVGSGKNWKFRAGGKIVYVRPVNENVLLGSADNFVYFMSVEYGNLLWKRRLPGRVANGGLIGRDLAVFTVVGERSAYLLELEDGRIVDRLELREEDAFLLTPIRANGEYLIAATAKGLTAFSTDCGHEKSGKQLPLNGS